MPDISKLYMKAQASPKNLAFSDLCALVEGIGYEFKRQRGSHRVYKCSKIHNIDDAMINIQDCQGKAKPYQVSIVLTIIEKYNFL